MDIRQSYEKINISEQAKNQIKNDILAGEKTVRKENCSGAYKKYGKIAVAAALALVLIVPSGVMAAGSCTDILRHPFRRTNIRLLLK